MGRHAGSHPAARFTPDLDSATLLSVNPPRTLRRRVVLLAVTALAATLLTGGLGPVGAHAGGPVIPPAPTGPQPTHPRPGNILPPPTPLPAHCTTTGPLFSSLPFPASQIPTYDPSDSESSASLQATNNRGLWAGYAHNMNQFALIYWSSTTHRLSVLDRFTYQSSYSVAQTERMSVRVVGVTAAGSVIAYVQRPDRSVESDQGTAYVYIDGHRYEYRREANWTTVIPVGLAANGALIAEARSGTSTWYVISYSKYSAYSVLYRSTYEPYAAVDSAGDVTYYTPGGQDVLRLASGVTVPIAGFRYGEYSAPLTGGTADSRFIGADSDTDAAASWSVRDVQPGQPLRPRLLMALTSRVGSVPLLVGADGSFITTTADRYVFLRTADNHLAAVPAVAGTSGYIGSSFGLAADGTLAYSGYSDGLPRLLHC